MNLAQRNRQPEIMDQPGLPEPEHYHALRALERINRWSGSARILWPPIRNLAQNSPQPLRLLDIASGAGDIPIRLARQARRAGLPIQIEGCDLNPQAVAYANRRAQAKQIDVRFFQLNALEGTIPSDYDILTTSLFLHHLDDEAAGNLLRRMGQAARKLVLVNDLIRSPVGYALAYVGSRLFTTSHVVHTDGPLSVAAAFTRGEARILAERAGLQGATVAWRWPFRFLLSWRRS